MIRLQKNEINLAFHRFLYDSQDDFFPDPIRYKDFKYIQNEVEDFIKNMLRETFKVYSNTKKIKYKNQYYSQWDLPKSHHVVRSAILLHPYDRIVYQFILGRVIKEIEPKLSKSRYSYRIKNYKSKNIFKRPVTNWLEFKTDIRDLFKDDPKYEYLVSTDIAGFFEYTHIVDFKNQMYHLVDRKKDRFIPIIELLNHLLKIFSPSVNRHSGIPQNYDPSSYLATAFLDFLDKDIESLNFNHFRYVDDIKIACKDFKQAQQAILKTIQSLRSMNLNLATHKTEIWHKNDENFKSFVKEFPSILKDADDAVKTKSKSKINKILPKLVLNIKELMKEKNFNEQLFRAYIGRIVKCHWFKDIKKVRLDSIGRKCVKLIGVFPARTDSFIRFLILLKNKKYIQEGLHIVLKDTIYYWQKMWIWHLLIEADKVKVTDIFDYARISIRDTENTPARCYAILFLGKHGNYQDRSNIASLYSESNPFYLNRCIILALQEYTNKTTIYNQIISTNNDFTLTGLIKYIRQLNDPEYVYEDKRIGSDQTFIS